MSACVNRKFVLLGVLVAWLDVASSEAGPANQDLMYLLVRQWTATFCESESCLSGKVPEQMTIHGLWPSGRSYDDKQLSYCTNEKFDISNLSDETIKRANCAWITSTSESNEGFWGYEFNKHGTCAPTLTSQEEYFATTLDLNDKYDLNTAFANSGISFDDKNDQPTVKELEQAMEKEFGIGGQVVKCRDDDNLFEIYMCFDVDTLKPFECDSSYWNTCGSDSSDVTFPEGNTETASSCSLTGNKQVTGGGGTDPADKNSCRTARLAGATVLSSLLPLVV
jgi:ribonuclease T2